MNLHYETVSPLLKETLQKLVNSPIFKDFTLIGGTCLSLQLGHRRSIDIDLFTDIDYGTMNTKEMKEFIQRSFPYSEKSYICFFHDKIYIYVSKICIYSIIQNV